MFCPNCGLSNADNARFCANCGTSLAPGAASQQQQQSQQQGAPPPNPSAWTQGGSAGGNYGPAPVVSASGLTPRNIALGCLILLVVFVLFQGACVRACFHRRVYLHRRYASVSVKEVLSQRSEPARIIQARREAEV